MMMLLMLMIIVVVYERHDSYMTDMTHTHESQQTMMRLMEKLMTKVIICCDPTPAALIGGVEDSSIADWRLTCHFPALANKAI